jgi:O-antigen/teichoic acid export membrane protein
MIAREMQFKRSTVAHWVDAISGVAVSIGLAVSGYGYWSIILGHLTGTLCQVAVVTWLSRWRPTFRFSMAALRDLLGFGLGVHMKRLLQFACFNIDTLIVGSVLGMTALGFYDKAFTLMNRLLGRLALGGGNFRIFAIIHEDRVRYRRAYLRMTLAISLIALPGFGALMVMAPAVIVVLFGKSWLPSVVPFQILCVAGVIRLYDGYASAANEVMGVIWLQVRRQAVGVVLVAVFTWLGSRYGGVVGAAIGITAALALLTASMQALVIRETGITAGEMLRAQLPAAVCALGIMVVALCTEILIRRWVHEPAAWTMLLGQAGTGCIFYAWFILRSPFASVRGLVHETIADLGLETRLLTALVAR